MDMTTTAVSSSTAAQQDQAAGATSTLGKNDFLKLLTAQLQNQDPLQPVDNTAFVAQLAQFSSLEQMQNVSTQLSTLTQAMTTSGSLSAASLVGKTVSYAGGGVDVKDGATPSLQISLPSAALVTAVIQDSNGRTVRTLNAGVRAAGTSDLGWDARDDSGNGVPAGHYTVRLSAKGADGSAVAATARSAGVVQGVSLSGGTTQLMVGGSLVDISDVLQITNS
jgi:flagellar basal-body rod modification protein FlgD